MKYSESEKVNAAANVANRILGFVNAPTLQQKVVARCLNEETDLSYYNRNRETLYNGLIDCGFTCIKPEGAFYLFMKSPVENREGVLRGGKRVQYFNRAGKFFWLSGICTYCILCSV